MSERQAEAKQAELVREKQHQDAINSDTVAVDFSQATIEHPTALPIVAEDHSAANGSPRFVVCMATSH
jgi:type IV secretion system protein VirB10